MNTGTFLKIKYRTGDVIFFKDVFISSSQIYFKGRTRSVFWVEYKQSPIWVVGAEFGKKGLKPLNPKLTKNIDNISH